MSPKDQTPTHLFAFSVLITPFSQFPKRFVLVGGVILKDMCTILQIIFAKEHSMNKC
jgi:hypothetical protein